MNRARRGQGYGEVNEANKGGCISSYICGVKQESGWLMLAESHQSMVDILQSDIINIIVCLNSPAATTMTTTTTSNKSSTRAARAKRRRHLLGSSKTALTTSTLRKSWSTFPVTMHSSRNALRYHRDRRGGTGVGGGAVQEIIEMGHHVDGLAHLGAGPV